MRPANLKQLLVAAGEAENKYVFDLVSGKDNTGEERNATLDALHLAVAELCNAWGETMTHADDPEEDPVPVLIYRVDLNTFRRLLREADNG